MIIETRSDRVCREVAQWNRRHNYLRRSRVLYRLGRIWLEDATGRLLGHLDGEPEFCRERPLPGDSMFIGPRH